MMFTPVVTHPSDALLWRIDRCSRQTWLLAPGRPGQPAGEVRASDSHDDGIEFMRNPTMDVPTYLRDAPSALQGLGLRLLEAAAAARAARSAADAERAARVAEFDARAAASAIAARARLVGTCDAAAAAARAGEVDGLDAAVAAVRGAIAARTAELAALDDERAAALASVSGAAAADAALDTFKTMLDATEAAWSAAQAAGSITQRFPWQLAMAADADVEGGEAVTLGGGDITDADGVSIFTARCSVCAVVIQNGRLFGCGVVRWHCLECPQDSSVCHTCHDCLYGLWAALQAVGPHATPAAEAARERAITGVLKLHPHAPGCVLPHPLPVEDDFIAGVVPQPLQPAGASAATAGGEDESSHTDLLPARSASVRAARVAAVVDGQHRSHLLVPEVTFPVSQREFVFGGRKPGIVDTFRRAFTWFGQRPCMGTLFRVPLAPVPSLGGAGVTTAVALPSAAAAACAVVYRSYAQVGARVQRIEAVLRREAAPRTCVALSLRPCPLWYELEFAVICSGRTACGLHDGWRVADWAAAATHARVTIALVDAPMLCALAAAERAAVAYAGASASAPVAMRRVLPPSLEKVLLVSGADMDWDPHVPLPRGMEGATPVALEYQPPPPVGLPAAVAQLQALGIHVLPMDRSAPATPLPAAETDVSALPATATAIAPLDPDGTAIILFSSGTTGTPKGMAISRRAWLTDIGIANFQRPFVSVSHLAPVWGADKLTVYR